MSIYTIGHSNHTWDSFAPLLTLHGIKMLVDVRTNPASRWAPFANIGTLPRLLERAGIGYRHMGDSLGGKPADPSMLDGNGKPDYLKMRLQVWFQMGIGELIELATGSRVAIMCAEDDPRKCHRTLLLGPALAEHRVRLVHIRKDGSVQGTEELGGRRASQTPPAGALRL